MAVDHPHRTIVLNDGERLGATGWDEVEPAVEALGTACVTRTSGPLGKAGNLNEGLRHSDADLVAVIDADHVADASLARELLGWFRDPSIGFVTTPQRFILDAAARVLVTDEPFFFGAIQPTRNRDGCPFSVGNGVVYRRAALDDIGGFSEWNRVEDMHTSLRLHERGWRSVHHPEAVTTGEAPKTVAEYLKQRKRWAMDGTRIMVFDNPLRHRELSVPARLHYLQATTAFTLASLQLVYLLAPVLWLVTRVPLVRSPSASAYFGHTVPYLGAVAAFLVVLGGARGAWGAVQSSMFTAPTCAVALVATITRRPPAFAPTNKDRPPRVSGLIVLTALVSAVILLALVWSLVDRRPGSSRVALAWTAFDLVVLAGPWLLSIGAGATSRRILRSGLAIAIALGLVAGPHVPRPVLDEFGRPVSVGPPVLASWTAAPVPPLRSLGLRRLAGVVVGDSPPTTGARQWEARVKTAPPIVEWYQQWQSGETRFRGDWAAEVAKQGSLPMISWEPWARPPGRNSDPEQPSGQLALIAAGVFDDYIRAWAQGAATYRGPLLLRPLHEMNGFWYPWSVGVNGNTSTQFVAAWRHLHAVFDEAGASNVKWVWSINTLDGLPAGSAAELRALYPGDDVVDWVGVSGYNWGQSYPWSSWSSVERVFGRTLTEIRRLGKPILITEVGSSKKGGDASAWLRDAVGFFGAAPDVDAVVWFNGSTVDGTDLRIEGSAAHTLRSALAIPQGPQTGSR